MRKCFIRVAAAVILTVVLTALLNRIFSPKYITENLDGRITGEFYTQAKDPDVIFLGASTVHYCISPDQLWHLFGFTSYDRSNASQTMWQSYYMLTDTLRFTKPSLVVLDVSFIKNGEEFVEEPSNRKVIDDMRDPVSKLGAVRSSAGDFEQPLSYFIPVLRYHSRWKELTWQDVKYAFVRPNVTYDGYLMDFTIPSEQHIYEPEPVDEVVFPQKSTEYLEKIIELCQKRQIPLLLMKTPTFVNSWHKEYDEKLSVLAAEKGLNYVNFSDAAEEMGIRVRTDYIDDGEHMNTVGAHKFCEYLGKYLTENYDILFEKDEETVRAWDMKYRAYEEAYNKGIEEYGEGTKSR